MSVDFRRIYADTSVFGGVFDKEFNTTSRSFFDQVRKGQFDLVTSALVQTELESAPEDVRNFFDDMLPFVDIIEITVDVLQLQRAYLDAGIVTAKWANDALHVALATVSGCDIIISWNFHHIVHFQKIPLYNAVNTLNGYAEIAIHAPQEVITYEDEDL